LQPPSRAAGWAKLSAEVLAQMRSFRLALMLLCGPVQTSPLNWDKPGQHKQGQSLWSQEDSRKEDSTRAAAEGKVLTRSDWPETTQKLHINILIYLLYNFGELGAIGSVK